VLLTRLLGLILLRRRKIIRRRIIRRRIRR